MIPLPKKAIRLICKIENEWNRFSNLSIIIHHSILTNGLPSNNNNLYV